MEEDEIRDRSLQEESSIPDIMNDPQFATNTGGEDGNGEADTCRICRGEATEQEPLFYPCKCSGSIKFVHQDCLMEWLSHSQKKHCELCKTPFRFTKLYSPNMPPTLPIHVFVRHLIVHGIKNFAVWLRFCLVVFVWLGCLPWTMRHIWGFLFWFGDGGWITKSSDAGSSQNTAISASQALAFAQSQLASLAANGTSPATPLLSTPTTSASFWRLSNLLRPISQTLNLSASDPLAAGFFKSIYYGLGFQGLHLPGNMSNSTNTSRLLDGHRSAMAGRSSLLSDVQFLKTLTPNTRFNGIIITTLEGQIITIVVVVCFVLVFLIREWVVQQQPGINMGAGFNAEFAGADRAVRPRDDEVQENGVEADPHQPNDVATLEENLLDEATALRGVADVAARPIARPRRRIRFEDHQDNGDGDDANGNSGRIFSENIPEASSSTLRPRMPTRNSQSSATEIQRHLAEDQPLRQDRFDAGEFVSVWRRADGNPDEVLRIIEEEDLGAKLGYWKNAMKSLQQANAAAALSADRQDMNGGLSHNSVDDNEHKLNESSEANQSASRGSVDKITSSSKGKEKAVDDKGEPLFDPNFGTLPGLGFPAFNQIRLHGDGHQPYIDGADLSDSTQSVTGRPRATSEGLGPRENISPLANNSWSFSGISTPEAPFNFGGHHFDHEAKSLQPDSDEDPAEQSVEATQKQDENAEELHELPNVSSTPDHDGPIEIVSDGRSIVADSWDEIFASNPLSDSEDEFDEAVTGPDTNPFHPDGILPEDDPLIHNEEGDPPIVPRVEEPQGFWGLIADWLWGDMAVPQDGPGADDEHIVEDIAAEAPFVPVAHRNAIDPFPGANLEANHDVPGEANDRDRDAAAALAAGVDPNDPDNLEDAEDFEGIMELVGMRGPLTGLVQNGLFSAVLISLTVACGVWIPYNVGRLTLILVANPIPAIMLPLNLVLGLAAIMQDLSLVVIGSLSYVFIKLFAIPHYLFSYAASGPNESTISSGSGAALECLKIALTAGERIADGFINAIIQIPESEVPAFSAVSHDALVHIKTVISTVLTYVGSLVSSTLMSRESRSLFRPSLTDILKVGPIIANTASSLVAVVKMLPTLLTRSESWVIYFDFPEWKTPVDPDLSYWSGTDRFWAILAGYITFSLLGAAYLRKRSPFSTSQTGREWEATIKDILNQAGGVMKVILIISIEMLVFPLYCGLLLDIALLPLFENATISSRILFTVDTPLTSIFVHWFVGTCYMFHFALFVSMCRKIMRSGVLYFIRDPDDPTFHPVRDVLERNVATQLRKITFSAMVYGALVVICLGGVVWSLAFAFPGVLPIHWSSNEPVLEFPIDLLFYNFFMPLAVKFFKPSDGLHAMYAWWFRKCARVLRLTWFLFDERMMDEEGHHVRRTWRDYLLNTKGDTSHPIKGHQENPFENDPDLPAYFLQAGKYVRTPASDQVRIPKGEKVFLEVTEDNRRIDGARDRDDGLHGRKSELFKMVYIPPMFRLRIFLLILFIWLFAAVTGVCITIVPLVFGRYMFGRIIPEHIRKNDVYAFSIGIYILGSFFYAIFHIKDGLEYLRKALAIDAETSAKILRKATSLGLWILRLIYAYTAFALVLPTLFSFVVEFYFIVPLHTYFAVREPHVIQFVQSWTLGLLYVKLTSRFILWHADSRPAEALRAVTRKGYLDPDIRIATRCFILPATVVLTTALVIPFGLAWLANTLEIFGADPLQQMLVYRYAYPMCLSMLINVSGAWVLLGIMKGWRMRIRDEVYLIGERLHNFGDRSKSGANGLLPSSTRIDT